MFIRLNSWRWKFSQLLVHWSTNCFDWNWLWRVFVGLYRWTPSRPKPWPRFTDKSDHYARTKKSHFLVLLILLPENHVSFVQKGRNTQKHVKCSRLGGSRRIAGSTANTSNNLPSCCIFSSDFVATRCKILKAFHFIYLRRSSIISIQF